MGLLSTLAKIGGVVAAPFSGGASLALTTLGGVSDVLGKQQQGAAQGRAAEAQAGMSRDRNAIDLYGTQQAAQDRAAQTDLQRKAFTTQDRGASAKQALLAALLGGDYQPSQVSVPGIKNATVSGGLAASLKNSPGALAAMQKLAQQAGAAQDAGPPQFTGGQLIQAPTMTPLPTQSGGSKFLDILARIGQVGGAVAPMLPKRGSAGDNNYGGD